MLLLDEIGIKIEMADYLIDLDAYGMRQILIIVVVPATISALFFQMMD